MVADTYRVGKKAICVISSSRELFLSLRRALGLSFPEADFYFHDTAIVNKDQYDDIESPRDKKAGVLIADFLYHNEENIRVCRFIKYLRVKKELQFPLIFASITAANDMKRRYDILSYGAESHLYCQIPLDLSRLINAISSSIPMDDDNYQIFCNQFSEKHKKVYTEKILPLLKEGNEIVGRYNRQKWKAFIADLNKLVVYVGEETPLTCHERVLYKGKDAQALGILLQNKAAELSRKDKLKNEDLKVLSFLFHRWFILVTEKNFE